MGGMPKKAGSQAEIYSDIQLYMSSVFANSLEQDTLDCHPMYLGGQVCMLPAPNNQLEAHRMIPHLEVSAQTR